MKPAKQEVIRNPDGTFPPGVSGNPDGRPAGQTLKEYAREYYTMKTPEEKKAYIERVEDKRPGFAWEMAEGKAQNDITSGGQPIQMNIVQYGNNDTPQLPA